MEREKLTKGIASTNPLMVPSPTDRTTLIECDNGWFDMSTAPQDGSEFDVWVTDLTGAGQRIADVAFRRLMGPEFVLCGRQNKLSPTLDARMWRPIPDAPKRTFKAPERDAAGKLMSKPQDAPQLASAADVPRVLDISR